MSRRNKNILSDEDKRLWQQITKGVAALKHDKTIPPVTGRQTFIKTHKPSMEYNLSALRHTAPVSARLSFEQSFSLKDKDHNWQQKLRRGKIKPEGRIDLHGMTQDRAHAALTRYIEDAQHRGKRFILVITGKGGVKGGFDKMSYGDHEPRRGILRNNVPRWLSQNPLASRIVSYYSANTHHGGDGALYVILKKVRN